MGPGPYTPRPLNNFFWEVFVEDGRVKVRPYADVRDEKRTLPFPLPEGRAEDGLAGVVRAARVSDGWIVGFDGGEFGAGLWWFSPEGSRREWISGDQVQRFVWFGERLFALEGLDYVSRGGIIELRQTANGKWTSIRIADLGGEPRAAALDADESFVVVMADRLVRVDPSGAITDLLSSAFWGKLSPNSVVMDKKGRIYIGMYGGIAKVTRSGATYKVKWLTSRD